MLPLILSPDQILRKKAYQISLPIDFQVRQLIKEMVEAMAHYNGIGLAAPQINQGVRVIVIAAADGPKAFINPNIMKKSLIKSTIEEGCLSIPGVFGLVRRPRKIYANYINVDGQQKEEWLDGLMARVYQHEVDHLNGILFTDIAHKITGGQELLKKYGLEE